MDLTFAYYHFNVASQKWHRHRTTTRCPNGQHLFPKGPCWTHNPLLYEGLSPADAAVIQLAPNNQKPHACRRFSLLSFGSPCLVCHCAPKQPCYLLLHHSAVTHDTKKYPRVFDAPDIPGCLPCSMAASQQKLHYEHPSQWPLVIQTLPPLSVLNKEQRGYKCQWICNICMFS